MGLMKPLLTVGGRMKNPTVVIFTTVCAKTAGSNHREQSKRILVSRGEWGVFSITERKRKERRDDPWPLGGRGSRIKKDRNGGGREGGHRIIK